MGLSADLWRSVRAAVTCTDQAAQLRAWPMGMTHVSGTQRRIPKPQLLAELESVS